MEYSGLDYLSLLNGFSLDWPVYLGFNVIETIVLMGPPSFVDFMQLFIFQLLTKTAMRIYILPGVQNIKDLASYLGDVLQRLPIFEAVRTLAGTGASGRPVAARASPHD